MQQRLNFKLIIGLLLLTIAIISNIFKYIHENKPQVLTSNQPIANIVKEISGNSLRVKPLSPTKKANYKPASSQYPAIKNATTYFYTDSDFDKHNLTGVELSNSFFGITTNEGFDPNFYLSPKRTLMTVDTITEKLIQDFPKNKKTILENSNKVKRKLEKLDKEYSNLGEDAKRYIFAQNNIFNYLKNDYNINFMSANSVYGEPYKTEELHRLIQDARIQNIKYFYVSDNETKYNFSGSIKFDNIYLETGEHFPIKSTDMLEKNLKLLKKGLN